MLPPEVIGGVVVRKVMAFPFADARGALGVIADRRARGKVVLSRQVSEPPVLE